MFDSQELTHITTLVISLAIGLLIGAERGWKARKAKEGERIAGLRTYGLVGLLGGISGLLSQVLGAIALVGIFFAFSIAATVAYNVQKQTTTDVSMTGLVAMMLTFLLGTLATIGYVTLAAILVVIVTLLLGLKSTLHAWLRKLEREELSCAMQLLLISVVLLPVLPNRGLGPWEALNPYEIWWMVVLIASISFIGYFAIKIIGAKKGLILTAVAGGLASSTALTLEFARLFRKKKSMGHLFIAGVLIANSIMYVRILLIASVVHWALFFPLCLPLLAMTGLSLVFAMIFMRTQKGISPGDFKKLTNPLDIKQALFFGVILASVILLSQAAIHYLGTGGLYILSVFSGIADVDAINLSLSKMSISRIDMHVAVNGVILASTANTLVKVIYAVIIGGIQMGKKVLLPILCVAMLGLGLAFFLFT